MTSLQTPLPPSTAHLESYKSLRAQSGGAPSSLCGTATDSLTVPHYTFLLVHFISLSLRILRLAQSLSDTLPAAPPSLDTVQDSVFNSTELVGGGQLQFNPPPVVPTPYPPQEPLSQEKIIFFTRCFFADSKIFNPPRTLTDASNFGSETDFRTSICAAKWLTTSIFSF